mgnify:CR=1 FL=1
MTVCLDVAGRPGARPDLAAVDEVTHHAVVDQAHTVDAAFGITNVPMAVWIDEDLRIVRPTEAAWPDDGSTGRRPQLPDDIPDRLVEMGAAAAKIVADRGWYAEALRDWAANGAASEFVLDEEAVVANSMPRGGDEARAAAAFELGQHLHRTVGQEAAVPHFREAHRLDPSNWTYKRQAWELASRVGGPMSRFWQGPVPGAEDEWPYEGDWVSDINESGPENYYPPAVR